MCRRTERPLLIEQRVVEVAVPRMNGSAESQDCDLLAVEEPVEIRESEKNRGRPWEQPEGTPGTPRLISCSTERIQRTRYARR